MSWIKHDTAFYGHPKVIAAGRDARDVYQAGLCWSGEYFTDGYLPAWCLVRLAADAAGGDGATIDPTAVAQRLVAVGLWETAPGGFQIHDYLRHQTSRAKMRAVARKRAQAGAVGGAAPGKQNESKMEANGEAKPEQPVEQTANTAPANGSANEPEELRSKEEEVGSAPPTPPLDAGGSARAEAPVELRAVPKPWEVARATCEVHLLYPTLAELFGAPPRPKDWEALRDDLLAFDALGATPDGLRRRVANWTPVMGRRPDGSELFMSRDALITHWARLGVAPQPAPTRPPEVRGMVVPIPPPPRMTREQAAAYRREILDSVRRKETPDEYSPTWLDDIAAKRVSAAAGGDAVPAGAVGGDSRPPGG